MKNSKWYFLCDLIEKVALDLVQLPDVWANITGLSDMNDESLADLTWSQNPERGFLSEAAAIAAGISQVSIDDMITITQSAVDDWVRSMRDPLLAATDAITTGDRWAALDVVQQRRVTDYRQQLRDLTLQDGLNLSWPAIPAELGFVRKMSLDGIESPSDGFLTALTGPDATYTFEQRQGDQWLRIRAVREARKFNGVKIFIDAAPYWMWTDADARGQYSMLDSYVSRHSLSPTTVLDSWKTMSGVFVPFTVAVLYQVIDAGIANEKVVFDIAETHRQGMLAAAVPEDYDFSGGWPQTYKEFAAAQTP